MTARQLAKARTYVILGTFVFGAAATPSADPLSMLASPSRWRSAT